MSFKYFLALVSLLMTTSLTSFGAYAAGDKTQIKIGVVIKASSQCDYNYSLEENDSYTVPYSLNSKCKTNNHSIKKDLLSTVTKSIQDGQRYRVMMTVQ